MGEREEAAVWAAAGMHAVGGNASGLWWTAALLSSAVGAGMLLYGIRQKEPLALACGVALSAIPVLTESGLLAAFLTAVVIAGFFVVRKRL